MEHTPALEAIQLRKSYGEFEALKGLDLRILPGEVFCLLGANGAGKTTTIQLFLGFIQPTSGQAKIAGMDVQNHALETKHKLAYIPENVMLYPNLTGLENLAYFSSLAGCPPRETAWMEDILVQAGLPHDAIRRPVGNYSKGMRQKVGIAMAMARDVELLLLDEPTSGLDPKASNEFSELVRRMSQAGTGVLMATHDLYRSREVGSHIGIMKRGVLVAHMDAQSVSHNELESLYLEHMRED